VAEAAFSIFTKQQATACSTLPFVRREPSGFRTFFLKQEQEGIAAFVHHGVSASVWTNSVLARRFY